MITVVIASRLREDRLDYLTAMHASLTRQSVPWEALIALDGASPDRLPAPLAQDHRVRTLALPRPGRRRLRQEPGPHPRAHPVHELG